MPRCLNSPFIFAGMQTFNNQNFTTICDALAVQHPYFAGIINRYGYPPLWSRQPNFKTLIHFILEQQVSLASALAALRQLQAKLGEVTPEKLLLLSDEEMKACYFSRQKMGYARHLATAVISGQINIEALAILPDKEVISQLTRLKGIGIWTAEVFLMMAINRSDFFPVGDVALINSVRHELQNPDLTKTDILELSAIWSPYRTVAAYLFWHVYLERRKK